jgi:glucose-6-phosphate 1-dehydrogenase
MIGDATLFSRTDLVETAWRVAQPMLDTWAETAPGDFPNYPAGSWGPKAAFDLPARDGRRWLEVINRNVLARVPLLQTADQVCLHNMAMMLKPVVASPGDTIIRQGEMGSEMYFLCRGQVEVLDDGTGKLLTTLGEGQYFGELSLLLSQPRNASIRAATPCDLFVLDKADFQRVLRDFPQFASSLREQAKTRYNLPEGSW